MPARTGAEYIRDLRERQGEVWISGERIEDVTTHPATHHLVQSLAHLYDMQHDPAWRDILTYLSPTTNERVGMSFLQPQTCEDLQRRSTMMLAWARYSGGMMGRTPDYLNSSYMALSAASSYFAANRQEFAKNVCRYYEYIRENDLCLTHTLINPQANRSVGASEQVDPYLAAGVLKETDAGLVIRGCRMLATLAPFSEEITVFPSTVLKEQSNTNRYAYAFSIPSNTPGLKFICRESFDLGRSRYDHPLGSRFEELDAIVVFDDVLVPWERVFLYGNNELCNNVYGQTGAVVHMMHQVAAKCVAKTELLLGIACSIAESIQIGQFQHVQEKIAEIIINLETMKALLRASEADGAPNEFGLMTPARPPLDAVRSLYPRMYPRMVEILQLLGASGLMAIPTEADVEGPEGPAIERYMQSARHNARDRIRLFRLAWDVTSSAFGARQVLYERFFFGDPVRVAGGLYMSYDKQPVIKYVQDLLDQGQVE
ncbi:4-hydroxyphenylacetate 3-monooxygenase, oxygenase component [Ktedonosporobacter rubrisoli]|uniref:4-hydroxyphenylacetate 3-monooxygenase, oxygenase component n=1 Tax=Ktedonosporobacter rubrisoli TaxID=2509675 RepID=A0A4P6JRD1_KTERU|nr:4-hydroxyphenylacetate 3-monooxygenase, oxygenase component [Ktedonosporobacter rubrisoli]QBD77760.1 4-hydroxyphenylacetate 3-monooxygenase, oxygenase component [Ktedonosporobacter rubrisoli]